MNAKTDNISPYSCFHPLGEIPDDDLRLNSPFDYVPHPLCRKAMALTGEFIEHHAEVKTVVGRGKMLGVLIVRNKKGETGFLAAYSGGLDEAESLAERDFFVPPVWDYLAPEGYFKQEENRISGINHQITVLENDAEHLRLEGEYRRTEEELQRQTDDYKQRILTAKERRDQRREVCGDALTDGERQEMIRESQYMKANLRRMKRQGELRLEEIRCQLQPFRDRIQALKQRRKKDSDALQRWLFAHFKLTNARGEEKNLLEIFRTYPVGQTRPGIPPSGSGECCAPKLFQYAFVHHLTPLQIAECWWGEAPKNALRRHGNYYPACRGKCKPILDFMLEGLDILPARTNRVGEIEVIYEDEWLLVVNKPAGMLSVPGKEDRENVKDWLLERCPETAGPVIVHRLDMATSGLMILAKDLNTYRLLQRQFLHREIHKRYVALLDGRPKAPNGVIDLPLCADIHDRPRQMTDESRGKKAVTRYEVIHQDDGHTRVNLYPLTGRTHQLRVHCASPAGLDCPITGDALYGRPADRLMLHAEEISFTHPVTGKRLTLIAHTPF